MSLDYARLDKSSSVRAVVENQMSMSLPIIIKPLRESRLPLDLSEFVRLDLYIIFNQNWWVRFEFVSFWRNFLK
jgi:hypothetical protein